MNKVKKPSSNAVKLLQDKSNIIAGVIRLIIIIGAFNHILKRDLNSYYKSAENFRKKNVKVAKKRNKERKKAKKARLRKK